MAHFTAEQLTGAMSHVFSDASDAAHAAGSALSSASNATIQSAGSALRDAGSAAVQGSVQGLEASRKSLVPSFIRDAMPKSMKNILDMDSKSVSKEVGSGLKLFTACLVADTAEIRRQCMLGMANRPAAGGSRRNLLLTREKTSAKLEIERHRLHAVEVLDWQNAPGDTPLIVCCWRGDAVAAKLLLDAGADVSLCNHMGVSPLLMACHQVRVSVRVRVRVRFRIRS